MRDKIQRLFIKGHKPRKIFARRLCGFYAGEPLAGKDLRRDPPTPPATAGKQGGKLFKQKIQIIFWRDGRDSRLANAFGVADGGQANPRPPP